jgi:hypothetical protein
MDELRIRLVARVYYGLIIAAIAQLLARLDSSQNEKQRPVIYESDDYKTEVVLGIRTGCYATICDQRRVMNYESNPKESSCQF